MTEKKKILLQLSEEDAGFFTELLNRDDVELVSDESDAEFTVIEGSFVAELISGLNELSEKNGKIAHELKNPLASVKGYTDVILAGMAGELTEQQEKFLQIIKSNANQMSAMLEDMRDVASIPMGYNPHKQMWNIQEAVNSALKTISEIHQTPLPESLNLKQSLPSVFVDNKYLEETFHFLFLYVLTRPIRGVPPVLEVSILDEFLQFSISPSEMNYDFEIVTSGKHWSKLEQEQHWLLNAKYRIEWNGGQLWVESEFGVGSTFYFTIPIVKESDE